MATVAVPTELAFTAVKKFACVRAGSQIRSPFTGSRQVISFPYAVWQFEATLRDYDEPLASTIRAFLMSLEGQRNNFDLPVPGWNGPTTGYTGNGTTDGIIASRARSFYMDGLTPNALVLDKGNYLTVGDELKTCEDDIQADATGRALVTVSPFFRKAINNNSHVELQRPTVRLCSTEDDAASVSMKPPYRMGASLNCIEAIPG